jgi:hypothetical protein
LYHYQITYTFVDLGDGMVAVSFAGESIPPVRVPKWLVRFAFPKAQFDSVRKLDSLIE